MNLYTILLDFEDRSVGIEQLEEESPERALLQFINQAESLREYDRDKLLSIAMLRLEKGVLLIHAADKMKGFWMINFGMDLLNRPEFSSIFGGYIIQSAIDGSIRNN